MIGNNEILNYLLIKEDFLPEPTDLGDGKITIGSGLTDSKWLDLYRKRGNKWSKEDNRKAVLEEIQKRRLWAEQNVPHWNSLPEPSQDALLSYRYNYNFTPKNSPKLFKALEDKNYSEAAKQMDATSKNPDFKNGLLKRRKEEQQWFLSGFPELSKPYDFAIPYKYPAPEYPTAAEAYRKSMAPITDNYSQGGQLQNHKQWKDLSYSEKNDIIKVAVRNGITTLPEIRQKYNEFADEGNLYAGGGYVYDMLPQLFASDGVQVRVTSGYRPNSKVQGSGKPSRHSMHEAADIVGDFSAIRRVLDNPESNTAKWMGANGYGYLDETSKTGTKKFWHDQKGDHSHYHIGKDSGIAKKFATSTGITSNTTPIVSSGNYLDIAKAHIRNNEGWSPMPVADGPKNTGWRSVGYGFNDSGFRAKYPQGISKAYENGITKAQAEQELDYILGNMDSHLRRVYGSKWNSFNDNQKAAIIDTYYQRPVSVVGRNSAFYNAVMRGDNNAVNYLGVAGYNTRNNDRRKLFSSTVTQMPETAQAVQQPLFYQPWNPQAASLYTPYSPLTPYPAPIFSPEEQEEYFAKQIAQAQKQQEAEQMEKQRQEKADRINRFSLLMSLTDPYSSDSSSSSSTPFADAVSMLTQRSPISYFSDGGSIYIKPENRGKFTRLKERTGHSASWFKENGTPEQKKMATFALNARHFKHGLGGNLFEGGGDSKSGIPVTYFTQSEAMPLLADNPNRTAVLDEVTVKPYKKLPMQSELFQGITNQAANEKADEFANRTSLTPGRFLGLMGANVPLAAGALGATVAAPVLFDSTIAPLSDYITGSSIAGVPATTWLNTGMEAGFAGHGLNHAVNEDINGWGDAAMTALEMAPLGKLARPIYEGVVQPGIRLFNSPLTGKWTKIGNREYRLNPNSLGVNGNSLESRAITPQITAENTSNYPSIMADADDFSYKGLSSIKSDMEKIIYNNKIHGKPMYPSDEGITGFSKNVQTGVPKTEYNELLHDVIGRNVREFKRAGLNDAQVSDYINNAKNAMDNVHIGMYSNSDYIKGGWGGFGGFYDSEGNFISVNTGSPLSKTKVVKHEGRHLLDHKVDDEILMPTSESFGNNFDSDVVLSTMQKVKQNQNMILYDAYDNDFITLPNKKGFNDGLEGYSNMGREAITTNLDSRNTLLGSKADWDFDTTDKIIDKMPDAAIFEAVEKANGYGKRFIKFLRENNKLTPKKAQQFREAMKHVGAYAAPVGVAIGTSAATLYNKSK